ncbi:DUF3558 domain-containing protein [Nocardia ignorata]|uniref:Uncharacterized protein DUF3558 n=1 Tax=Nocardia ignorata TaxID=145285 RepID=A0A4R6PLX2_NOCIG|nr:DUF3558 domain-containing protein [Nocardia ignorata]TDP39487.1 uncharacterized protein DUF3558 [Nocardia ignorata]
MRLVGIAVGVGVALVLSGCGQSVDGQPEVSGAPLTKEQLFDPCGVPESALVAAGADPASKDDNPFSVPRAEWKGCGWRAGDFFLSLLSSTYTISEYRTNTYYRDFKEVTIDNRSGLQYQLGDKSPSEECGIVFDTTQGRIEIVASKALSSKSTTDPCARVNEMAPHFASILPQ